MGNSFSSVSSRKWKKEIPNAESSRILFLLYLIHRTWHVVVEHMDSKSLNSKRGRTSNTAPTTDEGPRFDSTSLESGSCYSACSCSYCRLRNCTNDSISELTLLEGMANCGGWSEEPVSKDKQRPPIYNPEDYAASLKKWGRKSGSGSLYDVDQGLDSSKAQTLPTQNSKDFRNPCLSLGEEMSLRQFGTISELLTKLRADLRLSFASFVQEFSSEPLDGVTLLLELLRNIQLSQNGEAARAPPAVRRRPLLDELACLQCLWSCCSRYSDCVRRLVASSNGVYALTVCIMSTVNKTRILALQLLTQACPYGTTAVSEALSTLRLRYGEPVRFRFLVGALQSGGTGALQTAGLAFLNSLLASRPPRARLYIQAELEQAGFDINSFKKAIAKSPHPNEELMKEIEKYEQQLIDIDTLNEKANEALKEKDDLRHKLELLEKRVKILQEEKGILLSLEKCLQEKCCELQEEVSTLKSEHGNSNRKKTFLMMKKNSNNNRDESSPPEDEGISSSERSLSPDGDQQRESMVYEVFNIKNETYDLKRNKRSLHKKVDNKKNEKKSSDEEDETTIDEVIQELRNIVNHAEIEQLRGIGRARINNSSSEQKTQREDSVTSTRHSIQITADDDQQEEEAEIVPSKILPHPPRKAKSLIHLFIPPGGQGLYSKAPDIFEENNFYSSDEGSDSLLSASRCQERVQKKSDASFDFNECRAKFNANGQEEDSAKRSRTRSRDDKSVKRTESFQNSEKGSRQREYIDSMFYESSLNDNQENGKCSRVDEIVNLIESKKLTKSLERIDEGLNSMVDIVVTNEPKKYSYESRQRSASRTNSDAGDPLIPVTRSNSRTYDSKSQDKHGKLNVGFDSPFNSTFIMKRGSSSGFYSGTHILRNAPASMTSLVMNGTHSYNDLKKSPSPMGSSFALNKVTDMPSGLY
ncbi:uncharacterized protein LOC116773741 isoform X1 [Danaus plexippus]|uniref:uncharacterized protein LOC116773741 isoform X1 n=2 Tax=Danaus plexippus TaxID=13037 RepID=UPI002AB2F72A|nr:uncharacterized protein LOC116773741 isoform X1 [Danaus plexippus]